MHMVALCILGCIGPNESKGRPYRPTFVFWTLNRDTNWTLFLHDLERSDDSEVYTYARSKNTCQTEHFYRKNKPCYCMGRPRPCDTAVEHQWIEYPCVKTHNVAVAATASTVNKPPTV